MEWEAINVKLLNEFTRAMAEATKNGKKNSQSMDDDIQYRYWVCRKVHFTCSGGYGMSSKSDGL